MASSVFLPRSLAESASVPRSVCARHGRPAVATHPVKLYSTTPVWVWLLVVVGLLVALVVALVLRKTVEVFAWPFCDECAAQRRRMLQATWGSAGALVAGVALAIVTGSGVWLLLTVFAVLPLVMLSSRAAWSTIAGARVTRDGTAVEVREPAAAYVAALPPYPGARGAVQPRGHLQPMPQARTWG